MALLYPKVNPIELEPFFSEHMQAMTVEALHSKADIAAQLAARDKKIIQERVKAITKPQQLKLHEIDVDELALKCVEQTWSEACNFDETVQVIARLIKEAFE